MKDLRYEDKGLSYSTDDRESLAEIKACLYYQLGGCQSLLQDVFDSHRRD